MKVRKQQFKNLWDTRKAILRGKFIALQAYFKKQKKAQINNLTLHLKELEKERQTQSKMSRSKEIIKVRAEINKIESKKYKRSMKTKSCYIVCVCVCVCVCVLYQITLFEGMLQMKDVSG